MLLGSLLIGRRDIVVFQQLLIFRVEFSYNGHRRLNGEGIYRLDDSDYRVYTIRVGSIIVLVDEIDSNAEILLV